MRPVSSVPAGPAFDLPWQPLPGGWSGESFLSRAEGEAQVVRIYSPERERRRDAAQVDAALARLVRGLVPVPEVVEVRPEVDGQPALLVTRYVPGQRADDVVRAAHEAGDDSVLRRVGRGLGEVAGAMAGVPVLAPGRFTAPDLVVVEDPAGEDVHARFERLAPRLRGWPQDLLRGLERLVVRAQERLDEVGRHSLVHGDLNPKNVVLAAGLEVAAVVDWEHAHASMPHADLGDLLRFDRNPVWERAVLEGWVSVRGGSRAQARDLARCADLGALLALAVRPGGNLVVDLADLFLREVASTGDWHAQA